LVNKNEKRENDLPIESNTSEAYFKSDANGNIKQLRVYNPITHKAMFDIDFIDEHRNKKTGELFPLGVAHVQEFKIINGKLVRNSKTARLMTDAEIKKWGSIIMIVNPDVRFTK
jgi:hypothetical protein